MRRVLRCAGVVLLVTAGLILAVLPGQARLLQAQKPAETVERGGLGVPASTRPTPVCAGALMPRFDYAPMVPFTLGVACLGLDQIEAMTRYATAVRLSSLPGHPAAWQAPRLFGRAALLRRLKLGPHHRAFPHLP